MRKEPHIPLFLWVTAALVAHGLGGGGAAKVAERLEETMDIGSFASAVRAKAKFAGPVEVSLEELAPEEEASDEEKSADAVPASDAERFDPSDVDPEVDESNDQTDEDVEVEDDPIPEEKKEAPKEEAPEKAKDLAEQVPEEKKPDLFLEKERPKPKPPVVPNRRVAVEQHVDDKNQDDNPNAEFAGEHANRVDEQTQARITATDQNAADPTAGQAHAGPESEPGNSDEAKVAQSDENDMPDDAALGSGEKAAAATALRLVPSQQPGARAVTPESPSAQTAQAAREARADSEANDGMLETHEHAAGSYSLARAKEVRAAQEAQRAEKARAHFRALLKRKNQPLLGFGSSSTTERGVNLNIDQSIAQAAIGHDELDHLHEKVGKLRLSKHRGSWTNLGLERWRGSLENYVSTVKPGNQTALNTARVPFARYLNQIHQRLHQEFADGFLGHLSQLPDSHPLNNPEMSAHVEIALNREDGRIERIGITKSSGVTAFDVGVLEAVSQAAPYGPPPGSIVSSDGNVYFHWEFYRNRNYACSTYFARPFILNVGPVPAKPRDELPPPPDDQEQKKPDERSGSLEQKYPSDRARRPG